ncbi:unannotated protein [freshwater metagenome]|uniref:Unannotated protein n=1 Tax=freshwater metagenome TaxID=449393 RepID=A0A6J6N464_9ZZZZ
MSIYISGAQANLSMPKYFKLELIGFPAPILANPNDSP